jgi:hypothetical protein
MMPYDEMPPTERSWCVWVLLVIVAAEAVLLLVKL